MHSLPTRGSPDLEREREREREGERERVDSTWVRTHKQTKHTHTHTHTQTHTHTASDLPSRSSLPPPPESAGQVGSFFCQGGKRRCLHSSGPHCLSPGME